MAILLEDEQKSDNYKIKENWLQRYQKSQYSKTQIIYKFLNDKFYCMINIAIIGSLKYSRFEIHFKKIDIKV